MSRPLLSDWHLFSSYPLPDSTETGHIVVCTYRGHGSLIRKIATICSSHEWQYEDGTKFVQTEDLWAWMLVPALPPDKRVPREKFYELLEKEEAGDV